MEIRSAQAITPTEAQLVLRTVVEYLDPLREYPTEPRLVPGNRIGLSAEGAWVIMWTDGPERWSERAFGKEAIDVTGFYQLRELPAGHVFSMTLSEGALGLYPE